MCCDDCRGARWATLRRLAWVGEGGRWHWYHRHHRSRPGMALCNFKNILYLIASLILNFFVHGHAYSKSPCPAESFGRYCIRWVAGERVCRQVHGESMQRGECESCEWYQLPRLWHRCGDQHCAERKPWNSKSLCTSAFLAHTLGLRWIWVFRKFYLPECFFSPLQVNSSPYESGWFIKVKLDKDAGLDKLMTPEKYSEFQDAH